MERVDKPAGLGTPRQVHREQLVRVDAAAQQVSGHPGPLLPGVTHQRLANLGLQVADVDAAVVAQVADGERVRNCCAAVLPCQGVDDVTAFGADHRPPIAAGRHTRGWPGSGILGSVVQAFHGFAEAETLQTADEVDDVTGGAAAETVEPVRDTTDRQ